MLIAVLEALRHPKTDFTLPNPGVHFSVDRKVKWSSVKFAVYPHRPPPGHRSVRPRAGRLYTTPSGSRKAWEMIASSQQSLLPLSFS
jgi:hypothetical protein